MIPSKNNSSFKTEKKNVLLKEQEENMEKRFSYPGFAMLTRGPSSFQVTFRPLWSQLQQYSRNSLGQKPRLPERQHQPFPWELTSHSLCSSPSTSNLFLSPSDSAGGREWAFREVDVEAALASKPEEPVPLIISPVV